MREEFEAWAKAPPFEFNIDRFNDIEAWPGAYRNYSTHCAWDAWQAAYQAGALAMRERAATKADTLSGIANSTIGDEIRALPVEE